MGNFAALFGSCMTKWHNKAEKNAWACCSYSCEFGPTLAYGMHMGMRRSKIYQCGKFTSGTGAGIGIGGRGEGKR